MAYTLERDGHQLTVTASSGIVRLDGKQIGKIVQYNPHLFGCYLGHRGVEMGIRTSPPPATLEEALDVVYRTHLRESQQP